MKTTRILLLIGASLAPASPAIADKIQVGYSTVGDGRFGPHQTGQGGEFTLNDIDGIPDDSWLDLSGYVTGKTSNFGPLGGPSITSFQTFCIEKNEFIYPFAAIYEVEISGASVHGGVGGDDPDPLSRGTAYLYSQFARGVLPSYNYGAGRTTSAAALQQAIWWLEEEITSYTLTNPFMGLVITKFGSDADGRLNASYGQFGVYVLNLTGVSGAPSGVVGQDQLYYAPDGGTTAALLGMALCGIAFVSRRFRKA